MINILSVDFDYFFLDVIPYDWGHVENLFFINSIWPFRAGNRKPGSKDLAVDVVKPEGYYAFWNKVIKDLPEVLMFSESHCDIWELIMGKHFIKHIPRSEKFTVWNFDQHHDLIYDSESLVDENIRCDNWAHMGMKDWYINKYKLIYPEWRAQTVEGFEYVHYEERMDVFYEIPKQLPNFDAVFVCRSGAWTPSWCDNHWAVFMNWWTRHPSVWNKRIVLRDVDQMRSPDLEMAKKLATEMNDNIERLLNGRDKAEAGSK